jgi:hypothetical protein
MACLQHLRLCLEEVEDPNEFDNPQHVDLVPLAGKLEELSSHRHRFPDWIPVAALCQLTRLTSLYLQEPKLVGEQQPPAVNPLVNLTSLRFLFLYIPRVEATGGGWLLHGLSGVSSLRSLILDNDNVDHTEQLTVLSEMTQLTCLWLTRLMYNEPDRAGMVVSMSQIVQQLTALQHLAMDYDLVMACGAQFSNLQQLTQLRVSLQGWPNAQSPILDVVRALHGVVQSSPMLHDIVLLRSYHPLGQLVPPPLSGVRVTVQGWEQDRCDELALLRPRQLHPLPHLAGVWEVASHPEV